MSSRRVTRLCSLIIAFLIVCVVIFFVELNFIENLRYTDEQIPKGGGRVREESSSVTPISEKTEVPCPHSPSVDGRTLSPPQTSMNNIYDILKKRKQRELRVEKSITEIWWYLRDILKKEPTIERVRSQHMALQWQYEQLDTELDSVMNWKFWQKNVSIELAETLHRRLNYLQNPSDCNAKKLVCRVSKSCGFGCQIHHVSYCFILAYATKRTLILDSSNWRYSPDGWNAVFQPVSTTCLEVPTDTHQFSMTSQDESVYLPPVDSLSPRPQQLPMAIPKDLADRLMSFHGLPFVWFIAQFLKYLMRPSKELKEYLHQKKLALDMEKNLHPIVGLHVRRTDKKAEARYHDIDEYMVQVEEWFDRYQLTHNVTSPRRIYIATDEPKVIADAKTRYPKYRVYSDSEISSLASKVDTRYSSSSLFGLLFDVTALSECDYIVCTFSSQVCRLAYELMQNYHVDASHKYFSLDDIYYFGGQQAHDVIALQDHKPTTKNKHAEIPFAVGDHLGIAGNEKNGFSVGVHRSTQAHGQFPSFKVEESIRVENFPTYEEVV